MLAHIRRVKLEKLRDVEAPAAQVAGSTHCERMGPHIQQTLNFEWGWLQIQIPLLCLHTRGDHEILRNGVPKSTIRPVDNAYKSTHRRLQSISQVPQMLVIVLHARGTRDTRTLLAVRFLWQTLSTQP